MASNTDGLQKTYSSFASSLTDEKLDRFLSDSEAIMAKPAALLLAQAGIDSTTTVPFKLLDTACGTGAVGSQLQQIVNKNLLEQSSILCGDINIPMLNILRKRAERNGWINAEVETINAQDSKLEAGSFTHVTISHGLHVIPKPDMVLKDTLRVLKPGGIFAFSTMHEDNAAWVPDVRSAFATLPFDATLPDPFPMASNGQLEWGNTHEIECKLQEYGFDNIHVKTIKHIQQIESAAHFVDAFMMMVNWLTQTYWTEDQRAEHQNSLKQRMVEHLDEKHGGRGWSLTWTMILATCQAPS